MTYLHDLCPSGTGPNGVSARPLSLRDRTANVYLYGCNREAREAMHHQGCRECGYFFVSHPLAFAMTGSPSDFEAPAIIRHLLSIATISSWVAPIFAAPASKSSDRAGYHGWRVSSARPATSNGAMVSFTSRFNLVLRPVEGRSWARLQACRNPLEKRGCSLSKKLSAN